MTDERAISRNRRAWRPTIRSSGDHDLAVAKLYNMLSAIVSGDAAERTAADNQTVRNVFVVGPAHDHREQL